MIKKKIRIKNIKIEVEAEVGVDIIEEEKDIEEVEVGVIAGEGKDVEKMRN